MVLHLWRTRLVVSVSIPLEWTSKLSGCLAASGVRASTGGADGAKPNLVVRIVENLNKEQIGRNETVPAAIGYSFVPRESFHMVFRISEH